MRTTSLILLALFASATAMGGRGGRKHGGKGGKHNNGRAVVDACQDDLLDICPGITTPQEFGDCFRDNMEVMSEDCLAAVEEAKNNNHQGGHHGHHGHPPLPEECKNDADKEALHNHDMDSVSEECKAVLPERRELPEECQNEADKAALKSHDLDSVSEECKSVLPSPPHHHEVPTECDNDEDKAAMKAKDLDGVSEECKTAIKIKLQERLPEECQNDTDMEAFMSHEKENASEECQAAIQQKHAEMINDTTTILNEDNSASNISMDAIVSQSFAAVEEDERMERGMHLPMMIGGGVAIVALIAVVALIVKKVRARNRARSVNQMAHVELNDEEIVTGVPVNLV